MTYLLIAVMALVLLFGAVLLRGAPYVPSLRPQARAALKLLDLQPGQTVLELGSGDGKVLLLAARQGLCAVGIELNPLLVLVSYLRTWRYRHQVRIIWGDMWLVKWPPCDGVYTFLLDQFMPRLDKRMRQVRRPLASVTFRVPGRTADAEKYGVFLYQYR